MATLLAISLFYLPTKLSSTTIIVSFAAPALIILCSFIRLSYQWQKKYPPTSFMQDPSLAKAHGDAWQTLVNIRLLSKISPQDLFTRALHLRNIMHGRKRAAMRARSNAFVASIEHFKQQNRFGRIFTLIDLKEKQAMDLSSLVVAGNVIVNPQRINALLTDHFEAWYATPCDFHPIAKNFLQEISGMNL